MRRVAYFYMFANLFNVWFKKSQNSRRCLCSLLWYVALIEACKEYPAPRYEIGKGRSDSSVFSESYGYLGLIVHQDLMCSLFLSFTMESETVSTKFFYVVILKIIGVSCVLNGPFTPAYLCKFGTGHLENIVPLNHADLPNINDNDHRSLYDLKQSHALISPPSSS